MSFLWPGGCSGHSRWRWWFTALGEILYYWYLWFVSSSRGPSPLVQKASRDLFWPREGNLSLGLLSNTCPRQILSPDFMSSKTYSRKSTASRLPPPLLLDLFSFIALYVSHLERPPGSTVTRAGGGGRAGFMRTPELKYNPVFTSAHCCASVAWQSEGITMVLFNPRVCFHFVEGLTFLRWDLNF